MEEFLRIKTPQWRYEVLEEQASLMEYMGIYLESGENGEIDFDNKFSTSIKRA